MTAGGTPALRKPSAAYEVDDFQLVAFGQVGFRPLGSGHEVAVQLDSYAVWLHAQLFDQLSQGNRGEGLLLPVDDDLHCIDFRNYPVEGQAENAWLLRLLLF